LVLIVYVESDQTAVENKYWYRFRPQETIKLNDVMQVVRNDLERVKLPSGTYLKFNSLHMIQWLAPSSVLIYKGLKLVQEQILMYK
jgi:carboxylesterase